MSEELDYNQIQDIIKAYVREELELDYNLDVPFRFLGRVDVKRLEDGSVYALFEYLYDEKPWGDHSTDVTFHGSVHIDPKGNLLNKKLRMKSIDAWASGPYYFMRRKTQAQEEKEKLLKWEANLKAGDLVEARAVIAGKYYHYIGEITKINPKSVHVKPAELTDLGYYMHGGEPATIPKRLSSKFSVNNGVYPLDSV